MCGTEFRSMAKPKQQKLTTSKALELYKSTLNFNVISRYDPAIKQLLYLTSHCVIYKFNEADEDWAKTEYLGTLALYLRNFEVPLSAPQSLDDLQTLFCYGLILLNRNNPECFSLGLLPNRIIKNLTNFHEIDAELNDNLIIVKNVVGDIYGLWVFDETDRMKLFKLIDYCLKSDAI